MKAIMIVIGFFFVATSVAGIIIPGLPTTPFLLLAAFFFLKSSPKHYEWLIRHKTFGPFIKDFFQKKGIPLKIKITAIVFMWVMISTSLFIFISSHSLKIIVLIAGIIGTSVVLLIKTAK